MQTTDTTLSRVPELAKVDWSFVETWIDPLQLPPYVLLLLGDAAGNCHILDPKEHYSLIKSCGSYDEAQLWLLEDEYEPVEGRLAINDDL